MRKTISKKVESEIFLQCRRRCAICFGLNRDSSIKKGQIAHLDKDNSNSEIENLVFLCLEHHDQYDSRTSQSKNLTLAEVRHYKKELERQIIRIWKEAVDFKVLPLLDISLISGHYFWETEMSQAELDIKALGNNVIAVNGIAFWNVQSEFGPNIGQLDFTTTLFNNEGYYKHESSGYEIVMTFTLDGLTVSEISFGQIFGMGVSFGGKFKRKEKEFQEQQDQFDEREIFIRQGNIYLSLKGKETQITFSGNDKSPFMLSNEKIIFVRQEEGIGKVKYYTHKIMSVDVNTLFEEVITDKKPYEDAQDSSHEIFRINNPTLSADRKFLYLVTERYVTADLLVKVEISTGKWTELFSAESFEMISKGKFKGLFLIARSEIKNRGRDIYYKLCDESGKVLKEFDSETSLMKFKFEQTG
jgi:hypothetical protein